MGKVTNVEITTFGETTADGGMSALYEVEGERTVHAGDTIIPFHAIEKAVVTEENYGTDFPDPYMCKGNEPPLEIVTWAEGTDEQIIAMLKAHYAGKIDIHDYWSVGDTRTISLSAMEATGVSESHVAQDIDMVLMNAGGKILSDGETECAFVVGQNHLLLEDGYINSTFTNVGGWKECDRREWCNSVYKDSFPSSIIPAFKEFINKTSSGGNPGTYVIEDSIDTFGLFAEVEITGNPLQSLPGEGQQIEWYQTESNRVKTYPNGTARIYFSRSPWRNNALHWVYIKTDGKADSVDTNYQLGLAPFGVI